VPIKPLAPSVAILTTTFYPESHGGIESHVSSLANTLTKNSYKIQVIHVSPLVASSETILVNNIVTTKIPAIGFHSALAAFNFARFLHLLRDYDIVHVHDPGMGSVSLVVLLLRMLRLVHYQTVFSTHGFWFHNDGNRRLRSSLLIPFYKAYSRLILASFDRIICVSKQDYQLLSSQFLKSAKLLSKATIIENPIDIERFSQSPSTEKKNLKPIEIVSLSRNTSHKNLPLVVTLLDEVAKILTEKITLHLIGEGTNSLKIPDSDNSSFLCLKSYGKTTDSEIAEIASRSAFTISLSSYEGFGLAILELMSTGLVPIVSNIPPYHYVSDHHMGLCIDLSLSNSTNIHKLADFFKQLSTQNSYSTYSKRSELFATQKSWQSSFHLFASVYKICHD
jgi:alpha-1,3-mannosyltransferase